MPRPIKWKKTGECSWEAPLGPSGAFIFLTHGHVYAPGQWVMHFQIGYGARVIDTKVLRAKDFESAAKAAVRAAKAELKLYAKISEKLDSVVPVEAK